MEVNTQTLSEQKESVESIETDQDIEPTEKKLAKRIEQTQKHSNICPRKRGRPRGATSKKTVPLNFLNKKRFSKNACSFKTIEPPEQWTTRRLRQNGRELVRNRITAEAESELLLKKELQLERIRIRRQMYRLEKQKYIEEFSFVKVEEDNQMSRERLSQQNGFPGLSTVKVEVDIDVQEESLKQIEFVDFAAEMKEDVDDQKVETDYIASGNSFSGVHERDKDSSTGTFIININNLIPEYSLHEQISSESPTKTTGGPQIEQETKFDILCNLIHSIRKKRHSHHSHHSQQHNRPQNFNNRSLSCSSNYILSAFVWHKLNERSDESLTRTERLSQQNGFEKLSIVKVEEDNQTTVQRNV